MMQNNFPRIYSLSTIGIKQHYTADYLFHPYRTDFSGESGSGKSMIADMIQLVLVGSADFKSSTDGNRQRDVKGMLVSSKGKSATRGYVFLNVEVRPKRYIVIGAYIEGTSNACEMFIIQNGYDWENITPLDKPVLTGALIIDDKIETLQTLCEKVTFARLKAFRRKNYHRILHNSNILSLDLTKEATLKTYANILRSFSRGKGFKTESENLKKFLFGDEEHNSIMEKYNEEVNNINNDFHEHKRYLEEIRLINEKEKILQELLDKSKAFKSICADYLTQRFNYWNTFKKAQEALIRETHAKIKEQSITLKFAELALLKLRVNDLKELLELKKSLASQPLLDDHTIESSYWAAKQITNKIDIVQGWLTTNQNDITAVEHWFEGQQQLKADKERLSIFTDFLTLHNIKKEFEASGWLRDFVNEDEDFTRKIATLENEISELKSLSRFSDIENPESLLRWAIDNLSFPIALPQESILLYFQKFGKIKPMKGASNRYIPFPHDLFQNIDSKIRAVEQDGFWISLDGVYEYINFTTSPLLNVDDPGLLLDPLLKIKESVNTDLKRLNMEKDSAENLRATLFKFGNIKEHTELYLQKELLDSSQMDSTIATLHESTFQPLKEYFGNKDQCYVEYDNAKKAYESLLQRNKTTEGSKAKIRELEDLHFESEIVSDLTLLENLIVQDEKHLNNEKEITSGIIASDIVHEKLKEDNFYRDITSQTALLKKKIQIVSDLEKLEACLAKGLKEVKHAEDEIEDTHKSNDTLTLKLKFDEKAVLDTNPDDGGIYSLKQKAIAAQSSFEEYLKIVVGDLNFDASVSIGHLASHFLPTVFPKPVADEDLIALNIADRLHKLTQDIQEIGSRKIEILGNIFNEVYRVYTAYLTKITLIDNYLKNHNRIITGGNRASLSSTKSIHYPDSWLSNFRKQLNSHVGGAGLFSELKEELDINKMMLQAFQQLGGSTKVEPEDLMNPQSYFDLEFDLRLDNDEINSGSNGQTYAANALLCLARLSLIQQGSGGLKVMPIDEAEGLGSNYDMLHELAKKEKYQIVTMAIETAGEIREGDQYIYIMNENKGTDMDSYVPPFGIFSDTVVDNINEYINSLSHNE